MNKPVIIAVGFSRPNSLLRLLTSINNASFDDNDIELIITLDGGAKKEVAEIALQFNFKHGNKTLVQRDKNIGLREHILWCGDQTKKYQSVIILEDDLFVDCHFYRYAQHAINAYKDSDKLAGIALYSPRRNEYLDKSGRMGSGPDSDLGMEMPPKRRLKTVIFCLRL